MKMIADYEVLVPYSVTRSDLVRHVSGLMWIVMLFLLVNREMCKSTVDLPTCGVVADCSMCFLKCIAYQDKNSRALRW